MCRLRLHAGGRVYLRVDIFLLLQTSDPVHVDIMKAFASSVLLIGRQLLFVTHWLESDSFLAYPNDQDASALPSASGLILLVGEGDADLGHAIWGEWWR